MVDGLASLQTIGAHMNGKDALFFLGAALTAALIAKLLVYNVQSAQHWF